MLAFVLIKIYIFIRFNVDDENVEPAFVLSREEQNNNEPSDPEQEETSSVRACLWPSTAYPQTRSSAKQCLAWLH